MIKKIPVLFFLLVHVPSFAAFVDDGEGDRSPPPLMEMNSVDDGSKKIPVSLTLLDHILLKKLTPVKNRSDCNQCGVCKVCKKLAEQTPQKKLMSEIQGKLITLKKAKEKNITELDTENLKKSEHQSKKRSVQDKKYSVDLTESENRIKQFKKNIKKEISPVAINKLIIINSEKDLMYFSSVKKSESSSYSPFFHMIKSVLFWVQMNRDNILFPNINPKKHTRAFGRISALEKLPSLDGWALTPEHKEIIVHFETHLPVLGPVLGQIRKRINPPEKSEIDLISIKSLWPNLKTTPLLGKKGIQFPFEKNFSIFSVIDAVEQENEDGTPKDYPTIEFVDTDAFNQITQWKNTLETRALTWKNSLSILNIWSYGWTLEQLLTQRPWNADMKPTASFFD